MKYTPLEYLMMDIAARHSQDSNTWEGRLTWFKENQNNLHSLAATAKEPAIYIAAVKSYKDAMKGIPSGYPISLDCSNSGMQLLSIMTGDRKAAELCNVIPLLDSSKEAIDSRQDGYTVIYQHMLSILGSTGTISRDDVKNAIMTSLYGSESEPKEVFGSGDQLDVFYATMEELAPLCWELNTLYLDIWDSTKVAYHSVMPDNFHAIWPVIDKEEETVHFNNTPYTVVTKVNRPKDKGRFLSANTTHETESYLVRELIRRCSMSPYILTRTKKLLVEGFPVIKEESDDKLVETLWGLYEKSGMLSARIIPHLGTSNVHLVDANKVLELIDTIPKEQFDVLCIHDCYRVLPNYAQLTIDTFRSLYVELSKSSILSFLLSQIVGNEIQIQKGCQDLHVDIAKSLYLIS